MNSLKPTAVLLLIAGMLLAPRLLADERRQTSCSCINMENPTEVECTSPTPGGTKDDRYMAFFEPHEYAWRLFLQLNRQGLPSKPGYPDPSKPDLNHYEDNTPVVWETWALASGGRSGVFRRAVPNGSEIYLDKGATPLPWGAWPGVASRVKLMEFFQAKDTADVPSRAIIAAEPESGESSARVLIDPSVAGDSQLAEEVRNNRCAYEFIVSNQLYNVEGLEAQFKEAVRKNNEDLIQFPVSAQTVKAKWTRLKTETDKQRYHWQFIPVKDPATGKIEMQVWGLVGLHITTKDIPNWFWCTFEHVDTEAHAEMASDDPTTRGSSAPHGVPGKPGVRQETEGKKWEYYRLRGVQVDFTSARGPTLLANSQTEHGFQQSSSCITCHSRAAIGLREHRPDLGQFPFNPNLPNTLPTFLEQTRDVPPQNIGLIVRFGPIGAPDPAWFRADRFRLRYVQTDFLWQMGFRALSTKETPPVVRSP